MKSGKHIISLVLAAIAMTFASCDDKLDIMPRGMSTLYTVDDLAALINKEWRVYDTSKLYEITCGQETPQWKSLEEIAGVRNSEEYAYTFGDESVDRAALCETDYRYSELYKNINYANILISKMPDAEGDATLKPKYIAQARILRAYFHFLLVNFYAAQYDEKTAGTTGGIPYVDNTNSGEEKIKLTVAQVYEKILQDCSDEVIANVPAAATNDPCRFEADFAYGVRAYVLFQMKRYDEARQYAEKALAVNGNISDRSTIKSSGTWSSAFDDANNYLFVKSTNVINQSEISGAVFTPELIGMFEPGDYLRHFSGASDWIPYEETLYGAPGSLMYYGSASRINTFGLNTEKILYVAAESLIMTGHVDEGLDKVDMIRRKRIDPDYFTPFKGRTSDRKEAVGLLHRAKRVEMLGCFDVFFDCKRLNSDPDFAADLVLDRGSFGKISIRPNSPLWIFPFPMDAVNYNKSLTQNI